MLLTNKIATRDQNINRETLELSIVHTYFGYLATTATASYDLCLDI